MRRYAFPFSVILLFFIMLSFPQEVFNGASEGLLLWFQIVLPTLLPFIIISNVLIQTNSISILSRIFGPAFQKFFHISIDGSFVVLAGFLCGYPMGAKVTSDLILTGRITKSEGTYLLSFCNNTSPMFIISYVIWQNLHDQTLLFPSLVILFASPILCSFVFRNIYKKDLSTKRAGKTSISSCIHFNFEIVDTWHHGWVRDHNESRGIHHIVFRSVISFADVSGKISFYIKHMPPDAGNHQWNTYVI